uniref:vomeronasal type-1 receptor 4-like n=1 Tax=Jaculus jaculus TaxID=51337 RepID=UPI001E1AFBD2|nr:vomeronasal type-1 receptor 4-like [Jaculus jaculus]
MSPINVTVGIMFLSQTALGILGNCACLGYFVLTDFSGTRVKPTDLIVKHLTWANFMVLLFKGIPQTMTAFGMSNFLDDILCKLIFYFHRVARGVSLSSTSLLSVFQVITISPSNSKWGQLKFRAPKVIGSSLGLCWALQLLINACVPMVVTDILQTKNSTGFRDVVYCAIVDTHSLTRTLYAILFASTDVMCLGIMTWASGSMVLMLTKHKKMVQHIHSSLSPWSSPEARATQSILALVSSFVFLYMISVILVVCYSFSGVTTRWLVNASVAMSACFPAFCPFLLLSQYTNTKISNFCCTCSFETTHSQRILAEL